MSLLGGRLCEVAYTNPLLSPFKFFHSNQGGGGHGLLCPLAMPVPQLAFVNLGSKRGSEATEWGEGVFPPPTVGIFFENSCMKTAFVLHINAFIRG